MADLFPGVVRPLPVLTLWQPWATLIVAGFKRHETRHWSTKVRGRIAIHAAQRVETDVDPLLDEMCTLAAGKDWRKTVVRGAVLACADLTGCYAADHLADGRPPLLNPIAECDFLAGNYADGRFGFRLDGVQALTEPLPLKSRQTPFWHWVPPADLEARLCPSADHAAAAKWWDQRRASEARR